MPGHMSCGCAIDVVLMDFFFWKTWTITSTRPDFKVVESMQEDVLGARQHAFFVQAYKAGTGLSLDDLYGADYGTKEYFERLRKHQVEKLIELLNDMQDGDKSQEVWALVRKPIPDVQMNSTE